jgi:hypothetical protein
MSTGEKYAEAPKPKHNIVYRALDFATGFQKRKKDKQEAAQQNRVMA